MIFISASPYTKGNRKLIAPSFPTLSTGNLFQVFRLDCIWWIVPWGPLFSLLPSNDCSHTFLLAFHWVIPEPKKLSNKLLVICSPTLISVTRLVYFWTVICSPNIGQLFELFWKWHYLSKILCGFFAVIFAKVWLLFIPTSGQTVQTWVLHGNSDDVIK